MPKIPRLKENETGFTLPINPDPNGYKFACCDCGLIHDILFRVIKVTKQHPNGTFDYHEMPLNGPFQVQFKARRNNRSTAQMRRWNKYLNPTST